MFSNTYLLSHFETISLIETVLMIDWIKVKLPLLHDPLNGGHVVKFTSSGEVEWETSCHIQAVGSHDSSIRVKSDGGDGKGRATELWISGNPSKFLQGHNVFGSDDVHSLVIDVFAILVKQLDLMPSLSDLKSIRAGDYTITMIDINYMFELPSYSDVKSWLRSAEYTSKSRHGRPSSKGNTVYWGKNSKRWAIKAYSKYEELLNPKRQLPEELTQTPLLKWSENKLRIELRLLNRELDELNLKQANNWHKQLVNEIYDTYLRKIDMTTTVHLKPDILQSLPTNLHSTYLHWQDGKDLRAILPKATYYRHRKGLKQHGINIDVLPPKSSGTNVVPMIKILEAQPIEIPHWAFETNLIHSSARQS